MKITRNKFIIIFIIFLLIFIFKTNITSASQGTDDVDIVDLISILVFQLGVIFFAAWGGGLFFRKLRQPVLLGEILAGTLIGPYCLGNIPLIGFEHGLFPVQGIFPVSVELYSFATVASIILLFLVGLETDLDTLIQFFFTGSIVAIFGVIFSFTLGDFLGILLSPHVFGVQYGFFHPIPLFLGVMCTTTSISITARILSEKRKMNSPEGVTILSAAVLDDILGIVILAVIIGMTQGGKVDWENISFIALKAIAIWVIFTAIGLIFSRRFSKFLRRIKDTTTIALICFSLALILSGIFEKSGLAMIIGAYSLGLSFSRTDISFLIQRKLEVLERFFVPIFFCVMGMLLNLKSLASFEILWFGLLYVFFAILGKLVGCGLPVLFLNFNWRGAARVGVGMIPRGEVALIIAGVALSKGIINDEVFSIAMIMPFVTALITPPIFDKLLDSEKPVLRKAQPSKKERELVNFDMPNPDTAEFVFNKVIESFRNEGFYVHRMEASDRLYNIRKDEKLITLKFDSKKLIFDCSEQDKVFIYTLFFEVLAALENFMKNIEMVKDKSQIGKEIFKKGNNIHEEIPQSFQILPPLAVEVALKARNKQEVLEELVDLLINSRQISETKRAGVLQAILEREKVLSTGMQDGIALPHAKTDSVDHLVCAVGLIKEGIDFVSLDQKLSKIFVLTLTPKKQFEEYLQSIAEISQFLIEEKMRQKILSCRTNEELRMVLKGRVSVSIS